MDVDHAVAVGVDAHIGLELGDVGQPLAAGVDAEGHVDVVADLGNAACVVVLPVVAGVDDEPEPEHDDEAEDAREQQATGLTRPDPAAAGASRPGDLLRGGCLAHEFDNSSGVFLALSKSGQCVDRQPAARR